MVNGDTLDAGPLATWAETMVQVLAGSGDSDVACGTCTACCRASQFVHIAPDERQSLAHVPASVRFPAPGAPRGHQLMGYDAQGRCPMLAEAGCSIYEHRPRTCRRYDCRVFAATGLAAEHPAIAAQATRWRFSLDSDEDRQVARALTEVVAWLRDRPDQLPPAARSNRTQLAVLAVEVHRAWRTGGAEAVARELAALRSP